MPFGIIKVTNKLRFCRKKEEYMKERTPKLVRTYYGWIFGAFTLVVGALFLWKVLSLYITGTAPDYEGASPFTRERVVEALSRISLAFWLWIAAIIAGFVLWEVFPVKQKQRKIPDDLQYARLAKRLPDSAPQGLEQDFALVERGRKLIFALKVAAWSLFGIAAIYGIVYLAIPGNFPNKDVTAEMLNMAKHVFPCIFAGLVVIAGAAAYEKYAVKSMLPSVKKLTFGLKPNKRRKTAAEVVISDPRFLMGLRIALAVIAVALIIWGALNGNARAIMIKAINICTECIGMG